MSLPFDYFFDSLRNELRHSKEFQDKDLRRILNRMDTYVSQQEVSDYIESVHKLCKSVIPAEAGIQNLLK